MNLPVARGRAAHIVLVTAAFVGALFLWILVPLSGPGDDFRLYLLGAAALNAGENPYDRDRSAEIARTLGFPGVAPIDSGLAADFSAPVFLAAILVPLLPLGTGVAALVFFVVNLAATTGATVLGVRLAGGTQRAWKWAALSVLAWPITLSLALGQPNGVIALSLAISAWAAARRPYLAALLAGAPVGLAAGLKLLPAVLLLYFLMTGRWAALGWGVASGLATVVVSALLFGTTPWLEFVRYTPILGARLGYAENVSLTGIAIRIQQGPSSLLDDHIARSLTPLTAILLVLGFLLVAVTVWVAKSLPVAGAYSLTLGATMLAAPLVWPHYATWLLPFVLAQCALQPAGPSRWLLIVSTLLILLPTGPLEIAWPIWLLIRLQTIGLLCLLPAIALGAHTSTQKTPALWPT